MAKKLLGDRSIGDVEYKAGQIISDEEATANGFDTSDVKDCAEAPKEEEVAEKTADKDAELDSEEKKTDESAQSGTTDDGKTIPHILTDEDMAANPELAEQGLKVGDEVRLPAIEVTVTEEMLAAHPEWTEQGAVVGGTMLVADEKDTK